MRYRLKILKKEGIRLRDIQKVIAAMKPLAGAKSFLKQLRHHCPVVILSDTFYEFAGPLMRQFEDPTLLCHHLKVGKSGFITGYTLRQRDSKRKAVRALRQLNFRVVASGDSYNDLSMLKAAHRGVLFNPPDSIRKKYPAFPVARNYRTLLKYLTTL
jgi:phosphoserine/homoserine phosphotransferase